MHHARRILARNVQPGASMCADRDQYGIERASQRIQRRVDAHLCVGPYRHAHALDTSDLRVQHILG